MTDILTPTIRLTEPTPGGDSGTWATLLNSDMLYIDEAINQSVTVSIADANISLVADGTSGDQARYLRYSFTGALTANRTVTLPANVKVGYACNSTTGGHNVILSAGATTLSLGSNSAWTFFAVDGSNNVTAPPVSLGGTKTNDNATAGQVGEFISAVVPSGSALSISTGVALNVTSVSLTAGDWDVRGELWMLSTQGMTLVAAALNTTSVTFPSDPAVGVSRFQMGVGSVGQVAVPVGPTRISATGTTVVYLIAFANFGTGTATAYGKIEARRAR